MHIVVLGPPGCGKGTQAKMISERYAIPHISVGDLFRDIAERKSTLGRKIKSLIDKGDLVPDDLTLEIVKKRLKKDDCRNGFILDGFPRNLNQAKMLSKITHVDHAIYLDVPASAVIKRLSSRRQCKECGLIYGLEIKPKQADKCDKCGGRLYQRRDDKVSAIKTRLRVFSKSTKPLINYYRQYGKLRKINGNRETEKVFEQIKKILR